MNKFNPRKFRVSVVECLDGKPNLGKGRTKTIDIDDFTRIYELFEKAIPYSIKHQQSETINCKINILDQ